MSANGISPGGRKLCVCVRACACVRSMKINRELGGKLNATTNRKLQPLSTNPQEDMSEHRRTRAVARLWGKTDPSRSHQCLRRCAPKCTLRRAQQKYTKGYVMRSMEKRGEWVYRKSNFTVKLTKVPRKVERLWPRNWVEKPKRV